MAHDAELRGRARKYYLGGRSIGWIGDQTGVSRATLQRWARTEGWKHLRRQYRAMEQEAAALVLDLTQAARESGDPQQAYAAMQAAKIAGLTEAQPLYPAPAEVAKALLAVLEEDPELGPLVRRKRRLVIERVLERVERMEARV